MIASACIIGAAIVLAACIIADDRAPAPRPGYQPPSRPLAPPPRPIAPPPRTASGQGFPPRPQR